MKKPVVDYRQFRLRRINEPQYRHLKLLFGWVVYFVFYFLTENLIPAESCHLMHSALDDKIPFNEFFLIPYCFWYFLIVISLGYFALYNVENFRNLQIYIMITQAVAMTVYMLYPSVQDLRPTEFARHNFFTWLASIIYTFDTPTGVCPSLHVAYSLGIGSCWLKEQSASKLWKAFVVFSVVLISISTAVVKQHSVIDILAALPLGLLAEALVFGKYWKKKLCKKAASRPVSQDK